jgi:mono/diheme cytochrome c family protein
VYAFILTVVSVSHFSCGGKYNKNKDSGSVKFQQYYLQGESLYIKHCSNCHQQDGSGLGRVYPPLNKSDFMDANFEKVLCIMRNGLQGEVIVNGIGFNQTMPANQSLTDIEIAEIATYIYNTWDHSKGIIEIKEVARILDTCP